MVSHWIPGFSARWKQVLVVRKLSPETSEQGRSHEAPNSEVARPRLPVVLSEEASPHARRLSVCFFKLNKVCSCRLFEQSITLERRSLGALGTCKIQARARRRPVGRQTLRSAIRSLVERFQDRLRCFWCV